MYIYDGLRAGCQFFGENRFNLCTNNGQYCATDPTRTSIKVYRLLMSSRRACVVFAFGKTRRTELGKSGGIIPLNLISGVGQKSRNSLRVKSIADAMAHAGRRRSLMVACLIRVVWVTLSTPFLLRVGGPGSLRCYQDSCFVNQSPVVGSLSFNSVQSHLLGYAT
jgi:hypothetical protein